MLKFGLRWVRSSINEFDARRGIVEIVETSTRTLQAAIYT